MTFLDADWFGNTIRFWLAGLTAGLGAYIILKLARRAIGKRAARLASPAHLDRFHLLQQLAAETRGLFIFWVSFYIARLFLVLPLGIGSFIRTITIMVVLFQVGLWTIKFVEFTIQKRLETAGEELAARQSSLNALALIAKIVVWVLVVVLALDNIPGIQMTSIIASLGIGGIAIGLALQNILGDLFSSLTISLDKPFVIGDSINVGDFTGKVEHIGLKSTRLRSLSGEELIFSNSDLLSSRIRNYMRMERRMVVFTLRVTYQTPHETLVRIPIILEEIIRTKENATFDRAHFQSYGEYALAFDCAYFIETSDYKAFMDTNQQVYLEIYKRFEQEGIQFAFPTRTVWVGKNGN